MEIMKKFDEMNKFEKAYNTLECCGMFGRNAIRNWYGFTRYQIEAFLREYSDQALSEPLDHIPERAEALSFLLEQQQE
jgi:hypothetical protein